jgi:hypothetical protein
VDGRHGLMRWRGVPPTDPVTRCRVRGTQTLSGKARAGSGRGSRVVKKKKKKKKKKTPPAQSLKSVAAPEARGVGQGERVCDGEVPLPDGGGMGGVGSCHTRPHIPRASGNLLRRNVFSPPSVPRHPTNATRSRRAHFTPGVLALDELERRSQCPAAALALPMP